MVDIDHLARLVNHNMLLHIQNIVDLYNLNDNDKQLVVYMDHVHMNHQIVVLNQDHLLNKKENKYYFMLMKKINFCLPGHMHGLQTCVEPNRASP